MADEEDLDLEDDDLDLGGDDFAGELDDMMGDEELGGDSADEGGGGGDEGGGGDDSELDSFFEDLSSIEDMDEGVPEPSAAPAAAEAEEEKPAEPAKPKKAVAKTKEKKGGKLKIILPIILVLLGLGGAGAWFLLRGPEEIPLEEDLIVDKPMEQIEFEKPPVIEKIRVKPVIKVEPPPPPPPSPKPAPPRKKYLVQVATCTYAVCKEDFINSLRREGEPVFRRSSEEKYDFIELISSEVYSFREANRLVDEINRKNTMAGNASIKSQSNGYRVSMGSFTALDRAKQVKFHIEQIFSNNEISFNMEHVRRDYSTTKIFAGPYESRSVAKKVLQELRTKDKYKGAFLVLY